MNNITYNWTVSALDCAVSESGLTNVVKNVHWRYRGTDENGTTSEIYGSMSTGTPNTGSFIAYDNLDLQVISGWLEAGLDVPALQENIVNQINKINNPVTITLPLPSHNTPVTGSVVPIEEELIKEVSGEEIFIEEQAEEEE